MLLYLSPIVLIVIGFAKFSHDELPSEVSVADSYGAEPGELPERRTSV